MPKTAAPTLPLRRLAAWTLLLPNVTYHPSAAGNVADAYVDDEPVTGSG